ncbi:MAG: helix-turn-helix transcriptional regulator [Symploca sp. SIO2C1]|nr:helix-turn-helix transcriptional regulator [Symploca sp. SIO2C1]
MVRNVIRWKLNEMMARRRIRNKDLAVSLGISENSVYRLRRTDEMPRLSPERLNGICTALDCQPGDLLVWEPDDLQGHTQDNTPSSRQPINDLLQTTPKSSSSTKSEIQVAA